MLLKCFLVVLNMFSFYYFTTKAQQQWWMYSRVLAEENSVLRHKQSICYQYHLTDEQFQICLDDPNIIYNIRSGTRLGLEHCRKQFEKQIWTCEYGKKINKSYKKRTRETAFINAISTAGVVYKLVEECDKGIKSNCGCRHASPQRLVQTTHGKSYYWSFCNRHFRHAMKISRLFLDPTKDEIVIKEKGRRKKSLKKMIFKHNNKAARKLINSLSKSYKKCTCIGASGGCSAKTCFRWLPNLRSLSSELYKKYLTAAEVRLKDFKKVVPLDDQQKLTKKDLIFNERLNYCNASKEFGILGTQGRNCLNRQPKTNDDAISCDILCCGRGTKSVKRIEVGVRCRCQFSWCCEVTCATCNRTIEEFLCL